MLTVGIQYSRYLCHWKKGTSASEGNQSTWLLLGMIYTHLESLKEEYVWRWPQVDTANAWWLAYSEEFPTRRSSLRHGWNNLHKPGVLLCHSYGPKQCFQFWHHPQLCVASLQSYKQRDVGSVPAHHILQSLSGSTGWQIQWWSCKCIQTRQHTRW